MQMKIKKFNEYINEDYFSKLASRLDNDEVRKENVVAPGVDNCDSFAAALSAWFKDGNTLYGNHQKTVKTFATYDYGDDSLTLDFSYLLPELSCVKIPFYDDYEDMIEGFNDACLDFVSQEMGDECIDNESGKYTIEQMAKYTELLYDEILNLSDKFGKWYNERY